MSSIPGKVPALPANNILDSKSLQGQELKQFGTLVSYREKCFITSVPCTHRGSAGLQTWIFPSWGKFL